MAHLPQLQANANNPPGPRGILGLRPDTALGNFLRHELDRNTFLFCAAVTGIPPAPCTTPCLPLSQPQASPELPIICPTGTVLLLQHMLGQVGGLLLVPLEDLKGDLLGLRLCGLLPGVLPAAAVLVWSFALQAGTQHQRACSKVCVSYTP